MTIPEYCYHQLALRYRGNYHRLSKLLRAHGSWFAAAQAEGISVGAPIGDPALERYSIRLLLANDPDFPPLLREIPWAPHGIYLRGAPITEEPKVAIVGTRKATPAGITTSEFLARDLARASITIVSGLAFGVDAAAHHAAISAGGKAIAVLASGLDRITPVSNRRLGEEILTCGGTLVSEYPPGTETLPAFFIARNRLVSGLSRGVIVIEAPTRSGTLATARFATDQNRELLVVPGPINQGNYNGSHALIRSGATLITNAREVLEALQLVPPETDMPRHTQVLPFLDSVEQRIVELLSAEASTLTADTIAERTLLGVSVINEALGSLVIQDLITESDLGYAIR